MSLSRVLGHYYKLPKSDSNAVYLLSDSVYYLSTLSGNGFISYEIVQSHLGLSTINSAVKNLKTLGVGMVQITPQRYFF